MRVYTTDGDIFDIDSYTEDVKRKAYTEARENIRQRKRAEKEAKRKNVQRKTAGAAILLLTILICKMFVEIGESDITFAIIPLFVGLTLLFVKDTAAEN